MSKEELRIKIAKRIEQERLVRNARYRISYGDHYNVEKRRLRYKGNKEKIALQSKIYYNKNKYRYLAAAAKRKARKLQATPEWLTASQEAEIIQLYKKAKELENITGNKYHVDHIVPLQGKNVCGLHVPWNLQIIPAEENLRKSNKMQLNNI